MRFAAIVGLAQRLSAIPLRGRLRAAIAAFASTIAATFIDTTTPGKLEFRLFSGR